MPARSTGCILCRKRKIRCDEGRPGCENCATHGVACPGYANPKKIVIGFKDQTDATAKRAEQRYREKHAAQKATRDRETQAATPGSISSDDETGTRIVTPGSIDLSSTGTLPFEASNQALMLYNGSHNSSMNSLRSPALERMRLREEFIATYLPLLRPGAENSHFGFLELLIKQGSEHPALRNGVDALTLVQLGSFYKDTRLLQQAVRQYGAAIRSLAFSIEKGEFLHDDNVLAAVNCLAQCELYQEIANLGEGWHKHVAGAATLAAARGPHSFKSEISTLLYSNMFHGGMLWALISRKAPFLAAPAWRALAFKSPLARDESTKFYDVAIQVPGLLQRHDELDIELPTAIPEIDDILRESKRLEVGLHKWYAEWQTSLMQREDYQLSLRPIDDFASFKGLVADRTFEHAYMFPDFLVGYYHSLYWMVLFHIRCNAQSLQELRNRLEPRWGPCDEAFVAESELLSYVLGLCQCIPFFVEPICGSSGQVAIFMPMRTAAHYLEDQGHWKWLSWLREVRDNVFVKGLAPPGLPCKCLAGAPDCQLTERLAKVGKHFHI